MASIARALPVTHILATERRRPLVLALVLLVGLALVSLVTPQQANSTRPDRWPRDNALFAVNGWLTTAENVEVINRATFATRELRTTAGRRATLTIKSSVDAKRIYQAGAEVPYLGNGYTVYEAPPTLVQPSAARLGALVAQRAGDRWLILHNVGERRGSFGTGAVGWGWSLVDGMLGQANDYYQVTLVGSLRAASAEADAAELTAAADTIFPRIAAWYAQTAPGQAPASAS